MALVDTWTGRCSPVTKQNVVMRLYRAFDRDTLQDTFTLELESGSQLEVLSNLTPSAAMAKWEANKTWWS